MNKHKKALLRRIISSSTVLALILPGFLGALVVVDSPVAGKAYANGNGLVVTKSVSKTDVYRDFLEDRLVEYEITVENTEACADAPIDAMLVFDRSGSMDDDTEPPTWVPGYCIGFSFVFDQWTCENIFSSTWVPGYWEYHDPQPITDTKTAAKDFVDQLSSPIDYVGLVSYSSAATLDQGLTSDYNAVKTAIDGVSAGGSTNVGDAIRLAHTEFTNNGRQGSPDYTVPVMILLTDGKANIGLPDGETYAEGFADAAKTDGIRIVAIGLGDDVNEDWLENKIASSPSDYYYAPTGGDLAAIYASIQATLGDSLETVLTDDIGDILVDADLWSIEEGGVYDSGSETITWDLGTLTCLDGNGEATVHFSVVVHHDAPDGDVMDNMAFVTNLGGSYAESNTVSTAIHVLDKWDSEDSVEPGDIFTYTIEAATGDFSVDDIIITDYLDPDTGFVSASHAGTYDSGTHTVTWHLGPQGPHMYGTLTLDVQVEEPWIDMNGDDIIHNDASIQLVYSEMVQMNYETTGIPGDPVWVFEDTLVEFVLIDVNKVDDSDPVEAGGILIYTIVYQNNGNLSVDDVMIVETYDANVSFVSGTPAPDSGTENEWTIGQLNPGDSGIIAVTVDVDSPLDDGTMLYNLVELQYEDPRSENGFYVVSDEEETEVNSAPVFTMVKSDTPDSVEAGGIIRYTLTYENIGNMVAFDVEISDTLPTGLFYVAGTSEVDGISVADPTGVDSLYTWDLATLTGDGTLAPDGPHTLTFDVAVDAATSDGTIVTDVATIMGYYLDQDEVVQSVSSDDAEETTVVTPVLGITKVNDASVAGVNPGDTVSFTVVVTNTGGADAIGVTITDTLPAGLTYVVGSSEMNGVSVGDPTGTNPYTWTIGVLPSGGSATLTFDVIVDVDAVVGAYSNASYADGENSDPTDIVTSTFAVVIPTVLGEETEPEGEVLGASGGFALEGVLFGMMLLTGAYTLAIRKKE